MMAIRQQRFPVAGPGLFLWLAAGCSGGGGVGGNADRIPPNLLAAAFVGTGSVPAPGDSVVLLFSEPVRVTTGPFGAGVLTLPPGDDFGAGASLATQLNPRAVNVILGTAPVLTPGTSTVAVGASNTAIADLAGNLARAGDPIVIADSDGTPPVLSRLTLNGVDSLLNGTGPAGGVLQVPRSGFLIDLTYSDTGFGVDPARNTVTANVAVATSAGSQPAGTDLVPFLATIEATAANTRYAVPATTIFPEGPVTLTAVVVDAGGLGSAPVQFPFTVRNLTQALQPFETTVNSSQVWFLDLTRDIESFAVRAIAGGTAVDVVAVANGRSDFVDLLHVLGLQSSTPIPNLSGSDDSNAVVLAMLRAALLAELDTFHAGANVTFTFAQPPGTFPGSSVPYNSFGYSRIAIAGSADSPGVLGQAIFDPHNQTQNDNGRTDFGGSTRLGVFLHTIVDAGMGPPSSSAFRTTFDPFAPGNGGTPIGNASNDAARLLGTLQDGRANQITRAIADLARFTAVVTAHECGHSVGLVANGAMPQGLYGNDAASFPGSTEGHIRTQALFPGGGTNIMSPVLGYALAIHPATAFNSLNLAYLREQAFYGN